MDNPSKKAILIVSLDTELIWGYAANPMADTIDLMRKDKLKVRGCIKYLIDLFNEYHISATWAIIGHLFLDECICDGNEPHKNMPRYKSDWYKFDPSSNLEKQPLYYGRDIIETILSSAVEHEIGCHSFSHVDFSNCTRVVAEAELKECLKLAKEFNINLESFVFPENKVGHIELLLENGFKIYRGAPLGKYSKREAFLQRNIYGAIDKIISYPTEARKINGIWEIKSSMFFCDPQLKFSVLPRALLGLSRAVRTKKVFHIFLHPHDLLIYPSLKSDLAKFLKFASIWQNRGQLDILTMGQLVEQLNYE